MWKPLADGWRAHVYDRMTGVKVGAYDLPRRDLAALRARLDCADAVKARAAAAASEKPRCLVARLVDNYQTMKCDAYASLGQETRNNYDLYLRQIREKFGKLEIKALETPRVRLVFERWRDEIRDRPRMADMRIVVLNNVLDQAVLDFEISANHARSIARLYKGKASTRGWRQTDIERLRAAAAPHVRQMIDLALITGARTCALRELSPANVKDGWLVYEPQKRGRTVRLPLSEWPALQAALDALPKDGLRLLTNASGRPWTREAWKSAIRRTLDKAGIDDVTFHDFRVTAITRWARHIPPHKIALLTGHSIKHVEQVLDRHYIERNDENVIAAVKKVVRGARK